MGSTMQGIVIQPQIEERRWNSEDGSPEAHKWNYRNNPAVRELLDHLADELALEYSKRMDESVGKKGLVK